MRAIVVATALVTASAAYAEDSGNVVEPLLWESVAASRAGIQTEVVSLYETLYQLHKSGVSIGTRTTLLRSEDSREIRQVMVDEGLYQGDGENFPRALDFLVCELNPTRCHIRTSRNTEPSAQWSALREAEILIPDVRLQSIESVRAYSKKKGDRIENIVVRDRAGCAEMDAACRARLQRLNRDSAGMKLSDDYQGVIMVPSQRLRTELPLSPEAAKDLTEGTITTGFNVKPDVADQFLKNVVPPPIGAKQHSDEDVALDEKGSSLDRKSLAALIQYMPVSAKSPSHSLTLGLIDSMPDLTHCEFELKKMIQAERLSRLSASRSGITLESIGEIVGKSAVDAPCGELSPMALSRAEHGTHLLGLWIAKNSANGGPGLLPQQKLELTLADLDLNKLGHSASYYSDVGALMARMSEQAEIINLSWGVMSQATWGSTPTVKGSQPRNDPIAQAISSHTELGASSNVLFVIAAGNSKLDLGAQACDITPVCPAKRRNVLSVTALTNDVSNPDVAPGANYGAPVDIGVPAISVLSSRQKNQVVAASGSSQAAAVASAAAAMLIHGTSLPPEQARNRLIYTSDLSPALQKNGGKLFGGRLNFHRAYALNAPWVTLAGQEKLAKSVRFGAMDKPTPTLFIKTADSLASDPPVAILLDSVRRLHRNDGSDLDREHTVFYMSNRTLQRVDGTLIHESKRLPVYVWLEGAGDLPVSLNDLQDFTAAQPKSPD
ncbi:S8 family serine peptidase [Achromobacter pestifer]|nr:S8 family serine peptidase [Achromobacter pestifer]